MSFLFCFIFRFAFCFSVSDLPAASVSAQQTSSSSSPIGRLSHGTFPRHGLFASHLPQAEEVVSDRNLLAPQDEFKFLSTASAVIADDDETGEQQQRAAEEVAENDDRLAIVQQLDAGSNIVSNPELRGEDLQVAQFRDDSREMIP